LVGNARYTIAAHEGMVRAIAAHPLGLQFATAGEDGMIRVWTGSEGRLVMALAGHQGPVLDLAWNRKGDVLASLGADGQVKLWQAEVQ
jgi:WD40 repeat protein